jgi:hypothetical protein
LKIRILIFARAHDESGSRASLKWLRHNRCARSRSFLQLPAGNQGKSQKEEGKSSSGFQPEKPLTTVRSQRPQE